MKETLIPLLAFASVMAIGGSIVLARAARRWQLRARLAPGGNNSAPVSSTTATGPSSGIVAAVDQIGRAISPEKPEEGLRQRLVQAGYYGQAAPTIFLGSQLIFALLGLTFGGFLAFSLDLSLGLRLCIIMGAISGCALLPNLYVGIRRGRRTSEIRRTLPDAIDLLEICVSAGMGLDLAWNAVADEIRGVSGILADEMALSNLEMHLGSPRADALKHMAVRTGATEISSLVATLVQSERFGTSIGQALRTFADALRIERSQRAQEAAEKLAVKLLFPMVLFIFPCLFVVILGPAGIKISQMLQDG